MNDTDLEALLEAGLIDRNKADEIACFLAARRKLSAETTQPRFDLTHVLWYAGALIVMGAMGLFTNEAFNRMGGEALAVCGSVYLIVFLVAGDRLWRRPALRIPAGLMITISISMVPLIIFGIQDALNVWNSPAGDPGKYRNFFDYVNGSWIYMEIGTIAAAVLAVWRYRFSFILLVAAIALWFMSMDLAMWFTTTPDAFYDWDIRRTVSMWFGLCMILTAWAADVLMRKGETDLPFWIHIFGALTFWGGMTLHDGGTELDKLVYCLINIGLIGLSVFLGRRVYAVFGAFGIAFYLGHLAHEVFQDVILFSFALSAIGIGVIILGLLLHKKRDALAGWLDNNLPPALKRLRPVWD